MRFRRPLCINYLVDAVCRSSSSQDSDSDRPVIVVQEVVSDGESSDEEPVQPATKPASIRRTSAKVDVAKTLEEHWILSPERDGGKTMNYAQAVQKASTAIGTKCDFPPKGEPSVVEPQEVQPRAEFETKTDEDDDIVSCVDESIGTSIDEKAPTKTEDDDRRGSPVKSILFWIELCRTRKRLTVEPWAVLESQRTLNDEKTLYRTSCSQRNRLGVDSQVSGGRCGDGGCKAARIETGSCGSSDHTVGELIEDTSSVKDERLLIPRTLALSRGCQSSMAGMAGSFQSLYGQIPLPFLHVIYAIVVCSWQVMHYSRKMYIEHRRICSEDSGARCPVRKKQKLAKPWLESERLSLRERGRCVQEYASVQVELVDEPQTKVQNKTTTADALTTTQGHISKALKSKRSRPERRPTTTERTHEQAKKRQRIVESTTQVIRVEKSITPPTTSPHYPQHVASANDPHETRRILNGFDHQNASKIACAESLDPQCNQHVAGVPTDTELDCVRHALSYSSPTPTQESTLASQKRLCNLPFTPHSMEGNENSQWGRHAGDDIKDAGFLSSAMDSNHNHERGKKDKKARSHEKKARKEKKKKKKKRKRKSYSELHSSRQTTVSGSSWAGETREPSLQPNAILRERSSIEKESLWRSTPSVHRPSSKVTPDVSDCQKPDSSHRQSIMREQKRSSARPPFPATSRILGQSNPQTVKVETARAPRSQPIYGQPGDVADFAGGLAPSSAVQKDAPPSQEKDGPTAPYVVALCSESFLENWGQATTLLLSGRWCSALHVASSGHAHHQGAGRVRLHDCPLLDEAGIDIELGGSRAILVLQLSSWMQSSDLKTSVRRLVKLMAMGRYSTIDILLCLDHSLNSETARDLAVLQNAVTKQRKGKCSVSFQTLRGQALPAVIAHRALSTASEFQDKIGIDESVTDSRVQERVRFLLSLAPSLSVLGGFQLLRASISLLPEQQLTEEGSREALRKVLSSDPPSKSSGTRLVPMTPRHQLRIAINTHLGSDL